MAGSLPLWVILGHNARYILFGFTWLPFVDHSDDEEGRREDGGSSLELEAINPDESTEEAIGVSLIYARLPKSTRKRAERQMTASSSSPKCYPATQAWRTYAAVLGFRERPGYKWKKRYEVGGTTALADFSRRPHSHSNAIAQSIRECIIELRQHHPTWGARKIRARSQRLEPTQSWPAPSTIHRVVAAAGLVRLARRDRSFNSFRNNHPQPA
ncbi:MAG TPA: helix-turn-helix domain-containing protein [Bryobacteraceae bacterium]|jgi:hypothetical protein|nr:helix-turn-helix domain-containing protein [Bryobacteraceae bacterium]